jgi:Voltage-dependent anion channel
VLRILIDADILIRYDVPHNNNNKSLYRVIMNHKIAAPVCFIQLSAPSITMYAMTIMAQPSREHELQLESTPELLTRFQQIHRDLYLPVMHCMMVLSLVGMVSVLHSLWARWPQFRRKEFSPAHVAFVFPLLSHANAVQAYRSGIDSFSSLPLGSPPKIALFVYWFACLAVGTVVNLIFTWKYVRRLPKWTKVDVSDEDEPVPPSETLVHEMLVESNVHETMDKQLVNPALLQANEAGSLIRLRRGTRDWVTYGPFVRTRKVTVLGFDFIMSEMELREERANLLDWVAKNAPKTRKRTLSIPVFMKLRGQDGRGIYGTFGGPPPPPSQDNGSHKRSVTLV